jgi:hypothetical protein
MNSMAIFHSYKLTHFADNTLKKTENPAKLSIGQKIKTLFFGVSIQGLKMIVFRIKNMKQ